MTAHSAPLLSKATRRHMLCSAERASYVFRVGCDRLMDNQNSVTGGIEDTLNRYVTGW